MSKILVVYYSRTGHTRRIGEAIAAELQCESEAIVEPQSRGGALGYWRSILDALTGRLPAIVRPVCDPADYDLVILGTPVWAGSVSTPMRAYVKAQRGRLPRLAFFCTEGGARGGRVLAQLEQLTGSRPVARLVVNAPDFRRAFHVKVAAFVDDVREAVAESRTAPVR